MKRILALSFFSLLLVLSSCSKDEPSGVSGCTNPLADNYDPNATIDSGNCIISGCTNALADNYNPSANNNDGSCIISGCTDPQALNYNSNANNDNGTCTYQRDKWIGNWELMLACKDAILSQALSGQAFTLVITPAETGVNFVTISLENDVLPTEGQEIEINGNVTQYDPPQFKIPFNGQEFTAEISVTLILNSDEITMSGFMLISVFDVPFLGTISDNCDITGNKL